MDWLNTLVAGILLSGLIWWIMKLLEQQKFKEWQRNICSRKDIDYDKSVHIAVVGETGTGKSSFINSMRGIEDEDEDNDAAIVGDIETTQTAEPYQSGVRVYWDCPGACTKNFPGKNYSKNLNISEYDIVCLLTSGKQSGPDDTTTVSEVEIDIINGSYSKHLFIVHSKSDQGFGDLENFSPAERRSEKRKYRTKRKREFTGKICRQDVRPSLKHYFVSSKTMRCVKKIERDIDIPTAEKANAEMNMMDEKKLEGELFAVANSILKNKESSLPPDNVPTRGN